MSLPTQEHNPSSDCNGAFHLFQGHLPFFKKSCSDTELRFSKYPKPEQFHGIKTQHTTHLSKSINESPQKVKTKSLRIRRTGLFLLNKDLKKF